MPNVVNAAQLGFVESQVAYVEQKVEKIDYPFIQYPRLVPVVTEVEAEWARTITRFVSDMSGTAQWFTGRSNDMPLADTARRTIDVTIEMAAIGYDYTIEELNQAMMTPFPMLREDKAASARRASEELVDRLVLQGDTDKGFEGLINRPAYNASTQTDGVRTVTAPNGASGSPHFDTKTGEEVAKDFNTLLSGIYSMSRQVEMADTLLLPVDEMGKLAAKKMEGIEASVLNWIRMNNVYTLETNQPLMISTVRGLETATSADTGRMIAYRRDPDVLRLHYPMLHRFLPPWEANPMTIQVWGIMRLAGLEIRRPGAFRYMDGISPTPTV